VKICNTCKEPKELTEFNNDRRRADGKARKCRGCSQTQIKEWRANNPERVREHTARRIKKPGVKYQRHTTYKERYSRNPEYYKVRAINYSRQLRDAAFAHYGGFVCACCGETERSFLCLDHIDGGGNKHRREIGGSEKMYGWLRRNNYPPGLLQVLCYNCNQGKRLNGNVCPHKTRGVSDDTNQTE
jgi:hypothetical protein